MIYFSVFVIAILFAFLGDKYYNNVKMRYIFTAFALLPPIILAAVRSHVVGTDVDMYITPTYSDAKQIGTLSSFYATTEKEYIFFGLQFIITKTFKTLFSVHFINQLIIMSPIMMLICYVKKEYHVKIWKMYAVYLFLQYNISLCVIRQNVAFSLFLIGFYFLLKKKYIPFIVFSIIAAYSHNSTIIPIICICILYFTRNSASNIKAKLIMLILLLGIIIGYNYFLSQFGFLIGDMYITRMEGAEGNSGGYMTLLFYFVLVIIPFIINKDIPKKIFFFNYIPAIGLVFSILAKNSVYIGRLAIPFMIYTCITVPLCLRNKGWLYNIFLVTIICFWYITYIDRGLWETYPYEMDIRYNMF